jgi:hypothetical protein
MPTGRIAAGQGQPAQERVSAQVADELFERLAPLQKVLRERHIPCMRVRIIGLSLDGMGSARLPEYRVPALEVWNRRGKVVAVITLGTSAGHFRVDIPAQSEPHLVPVEFPEMVVRLLPKQPHVSMEA